MTSCAVCGGIDSYELERRDSVPVAQNLLFETREAALACATGAIEMRRCSSCGFSWNARFDARLAAYGEAYDNDQSFSPRFRRHIGEVAGEVAERLAGSGPVDLLEIGCGQGGFLAAVARSLGGDWRGGLGFDPAWRGDLRTLPERTEVRPGYFDGSALRPGDPSPTAVVSRHVIEHVADPVAHLGAIRAAVAEGTLLFVETPDVDWSLRNAAFFDFYYEHCSLFTGFALGLALERAGFAVEQVGRVFDGQYLFAVARAAGPLLPPEAAGRFDDLGYRAARERFGSALGEWVDDRSDRGGVALWGGGSKGVTIASILPGSNGRIACAIDVNLRKQGAFMPCSAIPIVSPAEAASLGIRSAIVVNPAYFDEVAEHCAGQGLPIEPTSIDLLAGRPSTECEP